VHPILARRSLTVVYAALWVGVGLVLTVVAGPDTPPTTTLVLPLILLYGFICLSPWYLCRMLPLRHDVWWRVLLVHVLAAMVSASLWLVLAFGWTAVIHAYPVGRDAPATFARLQPSLFALAVMFFLVSSAVHYLVIAIDQSRAAETHALRLQMLTAQAEFRALRAQITPHFLFNSLNSISALTSADPAGARRMCLLLGDFLRGTLQMGTLDRISLAQELALVDQFLAIEQVRFGDRLRIERDIDPAVLRCAVPPLIIQPLAENALRHGVAQIVEGGVVRIGARLTGGELRVSIDNPLDGPLRPRAGRPGVGLENVRRRLDAMHGRSAALVARAESGRFIAEIRLPPTVLEESA
jgi:two-component system, LytTR family, sensor histidine kinase AlgZ